MNMKIAKADKMKIQCKKTLDILCDSESGTDIMLQLTYVQ